MNIIYSLVVSLVIILKDKSVSIKDFGNAVINSATVNADGYTINITASNGIPYSLPQAINDGTITIHDAQAQRLFEKCYRTTHIVYSNGTFGAERQGGFVWAPKTTQNDRQCPGYNNVRNVKKGDIILHCTKNPFNRTNEIVAVSIATSNYYDAQRPAGISTIYGTEGRKVNCTFEDLTQPIMLSTYANIFAANVAIENKKPKRFRPVLPFNKNGTPVQGYFYPLPYWAKTILLTEIKRRNPNLTLI